MKVLVVILKDRTFKLAVERMLYVSEGGTHLGEVILHGAAHFIIDRRRDTLDTTAAGETSETCLASIQ